MASSHESVSWTAFNFVVTILLGLAIVVVGGGFAWLHGDMSDIRTNIRDIRGSATIVSDRLQATREDMLNIKTQVALTNQKLDTLIDETRKNH